MDHRQTNPQPAQNHPHESPYDTRSYPVSILNDPARLDYPRLASSCQEPLLDADANLAKTLFQRVGNCLNWKEMKMQFSLAGPLIIINLLGFSLLLVSLMFVGHLGELELASASLAASIANVTGSSVLIGMACAMETLCGQAYGAGQYQKLGIYMQRAMVVLNVSAIAVAFVWANIGRVLVALGQDSAISSFAGVYARWLIPTLFAYATAQPLIKFLQAQSLVTPLAWSGLATLCCHLPICWLLVHKSGLGFAGAALANSVSYWINVLLLSAYVKFSPACSKTRAPLSWEALRELKAFFALALPSAAMVCFEWWAYEILIILSGLLPDAELQTSALSICVTTSALLYMVPFGISAAASTRVSNELGAGCPQAARAVTRVALGIAMLGAVVLASVLVLIRKVWAKAYSDEDDVIDYVASLLPLLAISALLDSLLAVISGVIRGAGWQKTGAYVNLGGYYVVGLPIGALLAFATNLSGKGLVVGMLCASSAQLALFMIITWKADWNQAAKQAADRVVSSLVSTREPLLNATEK